MTTHQRVVYRLLWLGLLLFLLHSALLTLHWLQFAGTDLPFNLFPYSGLRSFVIDTFFAAAGIYALADHHKRITYWSWLWLALGILVAVLVIFIEDQSNFWRFVMAGQALLVLMLVGLLAYRRANWSSVALVWTAGMALHGTLMLAEASKLLSTTDADLYLARIPVALGLMFWLMARYSNISAAWAEPGLLVVVGWLLIANGLRLFDLSAFPVWFAWLAVAYTLLAYTVFAAHCYRALSDRNRANTLAAHWHAIAVLSLLLVTGYVGTLPLLPNYDAQIAPTALANLPGLGAEIAFAALGLGLLNQIVAELRGQERRITGLLPFWSITAGWLLIVVVTLVTGAVQVFYARIGYLETAGDLLPLFRFLAAGQVLVLVGAYIYALGVYARRIRFE